MSKEEKQAEFDHILTAMADKLPVEKAIEVLNEYNASAAVVSAYKEVDWSKIPKNANMYLVIPGADDAATSAFFDVMMASFKYARHRFGAMMPEPQFGPEVTNDKKRKASKRQKTK